MLFRSDGARTSAPPPPPARSACARAAGAPRAQTNAEAAAAGLTELPHIATQPFYLWFVWQGGSGATLPLALLLFHGIRKALGGSAALWAMIGISAVFYAWWNPPYLALLAGSLTFNFAVARRLHDKPSSALLIGAVAVNLALLGYFKYRNFFLENAAALMGEQLTLGAIFIPLAISFYTFEQIALLVDVQDGKAGKPSPSGKKKKVADKARD